MKKNNKGFTLVELIVVLVILAILAAILVPALLGWIDKAREKQITNNAEAALVATQGKVTECYGNYSNPNRFKFSTASVKDDNVNNLADINDPGATITYTTTWASTGSANTAKSSYKLTSFSYTSGDKKKTATWDPNHGTWTVKTN